MAETHCLQDLRQNTALASKVFIQRDYSSGTVCQFQTKFPCELESRIDKQQFEETIRVLNNLYAEAEKVGGQSYLEGCLACLTAYTIFLCMETHYEKVLKKIAKYIQEQNEKIYAPRGLVIVDPIERDRDLHLRRSKFYQWKMNYGLSEWDQGNGPFLLGVNTAPSIYPTSSLGYHSTNS